MQANDASKRNLERLDETMTIKFEVRNPVTGKVVYTTTVDNTLDAKKERETLDRAGSDYRVIWDCK
jgi:hypothetical protein